MTPPAGPETSGGVASSLVCAGCGYLAPSTAAPALRCPEAKGRDDVDHVLTRHLDGTALRFPNGTESNPFIRYRSLFHSYHISMFLGSTDGDFVGLVERVDQAVIAVAGRGIRSTPLVRNQRLSDELGFSAEGGVFTKDETVGVSGSHKARHLMGTLLALETARALQPAQEIDARPPRPKLAVASCGNAALAAATLAYAMGYELDVFIPAGADPSVVALLARLGGNTRICSRNEEASGDPTYRRLIEVLDEGSLPFTCQGNLNGLAIEGGATIGYEIISELRSAKRAIDHLVLQVGGGALASACIQAFSDARRLGESIEVPRIHTVQTTGAWPLARAYGLLADQLFDLQSSRTELTGYGPGSANGNAAAGRADHLREIARSAAGRARLADAARHRSAFMWPWETEPRSIATGILDDETYDWHAVVRGMLETGGTPVVVDDQALAEARDLLAAATSINVDETGSAGLAGVFDLRRRGAFRATDRVAILITGLRRQPDGVAMDPPRGQTALDHRN